MKFRSLPFSVIGLSLATLGLLAIVLFQNQQFSTEAVTGSAEDSTIIINSENSKVSGNGNNGTNNSNIKNNNDSSAESLTYTAQQVQATIAFGAETEAKEASNTGKVALNNDSNNYECGETSTLKDRYQFTVINSQVSYQAEPGAAFSIPIRIKNTGTSTWCGENTYNLKAVNTEQFKLRLGTALPQDRFSQVLSDSPYRIFMDNPNQGGGLVLPGETAEFTVTGVAPVEAGIYAEYFSPVVEGLNWYHDVKIGVNLYVSGYTETDLQKVPYLKRTGNTNEINLEDRLTIVVDVDPTIQREYVYLGNKLISEYLISSGAAQTPTPVGTYTIYNKQELRIAGGYPAYRMPYWVGLRDSGGRFRGYGLHALPYLGSNKNSSYFWQEAVSHLGVPVSHGCVRRGDSDAAWLWPLIDQETTVVRVVRNMSRERFEAELFQELAMAQGESV